MGVLHLGYVLQVVLPDRNALAAVLQHAQHRVPCRARYASCGLPAHREYQSFRVRGLVSEISFTPAPLPPPRLFRLSHEMGAASSTDQGFPNTLYKGSRYANPICQPPAFPILFLHRRPLDNVPILFPVQVARPSRSVTSGVDRSTRSSIRWSK